MKSINTSYVNNNTMIYLKSILDIFHNLVSAQKVSNLVLFIFLVFNFVGIKAQEKVALPADTLQMRSMATDGFTPGLPKVALPTPNSSALTRYGDYPVDYRTGLIETKIPVYEVQSGSIKLPINIQYHASGRLANEVNGIFGMRWTIESGGVITRTMKGRPDEWESLVAYNIDPNSIPSYDDLQRSVTEGYVNRPDSQNIRYDSEFDVFRFVLPSGKQGKFILKKENGVFQAITLPYNAFKIQVFQDINYYGYFSAIQLTEADGTIYVFGNKANIDSSFTEYTENPHEGMLGNIPSAWYLKEIISSNRKYNISLEYRVNQTLTSNYQETVTTGDKIRDESDVFNPHPNDYVAPSVTTMLRESYKEEDINNQYKTIYPLVVSKINFDGGSVEFNYINKQGLDNYNLFLDHISIPAIDRTINFTTERNPNENELFYLKSVQFASSGKVDQKYDFDYYVPLNSLNDWAAYPCKDWWGYYKMNSAQHTNPIRYPYLIRAQNANIQIPVGYDIDRTPDVESMKIGMLKAIIYPTGGRTIFDYENNRYSGTYSNTASEIGPGLRIKEVRNQPLIGQEVIRHFKYGENEDGRGHIIDALRANTNNQSEYSMMIYYDYNGYVGGNPQNPTTMPSYGQIGYRVRDYSSDFNFDYNDFGDSYTSYEFVTEYIGSEVNSLRKDVYKYSLKNLTTQEYSFIDHEYPYEPVYKKIFVDPEHSWEGGKLIDKTSYVDAGLGVLSKKTYQEIYNYESFVKESTWDMPAYRHVIFTVDRSASPNQNNNIYNEIYDLEKYYHENLLNVYGYGFRKYVSGEELLVQKQSIEYGTDGSSITNQALFSYENQKLFPRSETQINSKGEEHKVIFQYSFDDSYINLSPHNEMVLNNIISQAVKKEQYINAHLSQSKTTEYKKWNDYIFSPKTEYYKIGGDPELPKIKFNSYDLYGGVGSVSIESGPEICYLYSYSGMFPIAKIEGGTYQQIVSILGGQTAIDIFSGFSEPTSAEINNFISPLKINLPRTHITSYTYKPLIGMTSMTDPKGMITTFEYDEFGRLKWLKDQNGNILNENIYHYKN